jgi:hypothetical protein
VFPRDHLDWIVPEKILEGGFAEHRNIRTYGEMVKLIVPGRVGGESSDVMVVQHEHGTVGNSEHPPGPVADHLVGQTAAVTRTMTAWLRRISLSAGTLGVDGTGGGDYGDLSDESFDH